MAESAQNAYNKTKVKEYYNNPNSIFSYLYLVGYDDTGSISPHERAFISVVLDTAATRLEEEVNDEWRRDSDMRGF